MNFASRAALMVALACWVALAAPAEQTLRVHDANSLVQAARQAKPGTTILLEPGNYQGPIWLEKLQGEPDRPILLAAADPAQSPVILGQQECLHISKAAHLELRDLTLRNATGNGLNIDDGGTYDAPAHHITLRRLRVSDIGPGGNRDAIKLSGLDDFVITDCVVERWGDDGSGIDMVGCHRGLITNCVFRAGGANAIQTKGGSASVRIEGCRFLDYGARGINIGGSTGLQFFRPKPESLPESQRYEARDITVENCLFVGGAAPVAFVGADGALVRRCTIYHPGRWALRILQENKTPGFVPSRNGRFEDNIVVFSSTAWVEGGVNIGLDTASDTFRFARNFWYCEDQPARSQPRLPTREQNGIYAKDPLFRDAPNGDFTLQPTSPAADKGAPDTATRSANSLRF